MEDERPPPLRLLYADELGQLKGALLCCCRRSHPVPRPLPNTRRPPTLDACSRPERRRRAAQDGGGGGGLVSGRDEGLAACLQPCLCALPHTLTRFASCCRGTPDKARGVDCMALGSAGGIGDTATAMLAVARRCGTVELLSPLTGEAVGSIPAAPPPAAPSSSGTLKKEDAVRVRGLHLLWGGSGGGDASSSLPAVLSVTQGGTARVHAPPEQPGGAWEQLRSWQVPQNVCCTAYDADSGRLAVGCEGAELRLFDAATGELAFQFKGGKPNKGEAHG